MFYEFSFFTFQKKRECYKITQGLPDLVAYCPSWDGGLRLQCPRQSAQGATHVLRVFWVECPLPFAVCVLDLLCQNNVSVQKYFCIFQLTAVLAFV